MEAAGLPLTPTPLTKGVAQVEVAGAGAGVQLTVTVTQSDGNSVTKDLALNGKASPEGLLIRTDKSLYHVGDTANVSVLAAVETGRVFIDVIHSGRTVLTKGLDIQGGAAAWAVDLDSGLAGDLLLEAYRVTDEAVIIRDKTLVYVKDADALAITITPDKQTYLPGEPASVEFEVADADGKPQVAAIGVQIVDEKVFALTEQKPGLLETWFRLQEELQQPKYQVDGFAMDLSAVVTGPDGAESQAVAAATFSALDVGSVGGDVSSWTATLQALQAVLEPHYQTHLTIIADQFAAAKDAGAVTRDNAESAIRQPHSYFDFWGNAYVLEPKSDYQGWYATVTSMGPDERWLTADDFAGDVEVFIENWDWAEDGGGVDAGTGGQPTAGGGGDGEAPRVRKDFPETLFYNPSVITDPDGRASVAFNMADSITEWRISALANTAMGALGSTTHGMIAFQDFFVDIDFPATLTRNDQVTFPVAIYNYLAEPQTVTITLEDAAWIGTTGGLSQTVDLGPGEVTSVSFPVTVLDAGWHTLQVTGIGSSMSDAVQRTVRVLPDGEKSTQSESGMLKDGAQLTISYPEDTIANSHDLLVTIFPGILAQAVEGLDGMLQMPSGCFEQTTATNWPNTLVLDYLRSTEQGSPEIELKALDYLHQGYQRLLTFECTGGGFVWFGDPAPANVILSAMGVLEFSDMGRVIDIDPAVVTRTVDWLVTAQEPDGHWHTDQGSEFATVQYDDVKTTAFVTWALGEGGHAASSTSSAVTWLNGHTLADQDVYSVAMIANALVAADPGAGPTVAALVELAARAVIDDDGPVHWEYEGSSFNYSGGGSGTAANPTSIEVTALAVQAFATAGQHLDLVGGALEFLAAQKDGLGNYGTTHATILTLRAMIRSLSNKTEEGEGTVTVTLDGQPVGKVVITEENRNVFHLLELGGQVDLSTPAALGITYQGTGNLMYQVRWSGYQPVADTGMPAGDVLGISVSYDKTTLAVNDTVLVTVEVENKTEGTLPMVLVDLGLPPGFAVITAKLDAAVSDGAIMKYELPGQQISVYLEALKPKETVTILYELQAKYPLKAVAKSSSAYLYYETTTRSGTAGAEFTVE